jgi:hypothetical protein
MAVRLYRLSFMATAQEIYSRKVVTRETGSTALVVQSAATPTITKPTTLQELYALKIQTRLSAKAAIVTVEV